jgi:thiamine biosynthesis lipoprotein
LPAWLLSALLLSACSPSPPAVAELTGTTMGTGYTVKLYPVPEPARLDHLAARIAARLQAINQAMSTYLADSDLSRFNRSASTDWQPLPAEVVELVTRAAAVSRQTDGAYDVTVNPLVSLWGFGSEGRRSVPPGPEAIAARMQQVGYRKLETRVSPPAMRKHTAGLEVDLSSIAKGWAVDELAAMLDAEGITSYLVDIGGELRTRGAKGDDRPWRIAVERPQAGQRTVQHVIALRDAAVATSGDYRNYFEHDGRRYSHTIDPRSGETVLHRLASVTVFAANATDADAWATALMALGDVDGPAIAQRQGIAALFIMRSAQGLTEVVSPALRQMKLIGTD